MYNKKNDIVLVDGKTKYCRGEHSFQVKLSILFEPKIRSQCFKYVWGICFT